MNDLNFWTIFCPILAALLSATVIIEAARFCFIYWYTKRQTKKYLELEHRLMSGQMSPEEMSRLGLMAIGMDGQPLNIYPTASGNGADAGQKPYGGQYL
jgi:hypothetical protein